MLNQIRKFIAQAIYPRQKNSMSLPNQFLRHGNKGMRPDWTQVIMNDEDFYTGYSYAAIRNRSNAVAMTALDHTKTKSKTDDFQHPYLDIIEKSPSFTNYQFWFTISTYLDLEGVFYLMAVRNASQERFGSINYFKLLNPYFVRRVTKKNGSGVGEIGGYIEAKNGYWREIPKEMIIEIRELNPFDWSKPFAITDAAGESQFTLKTAGDWTRHALQGNINAPGIVSTDIVLEDEEFDNFMARIRGHKKGEPIGANGKGAISWESMTTDLGKSGLKDINEMKVQELLSISGVSKTMMGIEQSGTTRETAKVQKDLLTEGQVIPRIQLINDALNQDYINHYPDEYNKNGALIYIDNPLKTDHEADLKETEVKQKRADLYTQLVGKGYDSKLVSQYIKGEIDIDQLGEPDPKKVIPQSKKDKSDDEGDNSLGSKKKINSKIDNNISGQIQQQEGALRNAITNIEDRMAANSIARIEKKTANNQFEDTFNEESDVITKQEKKDYINELELILVGFMGIVINLKGREVMRDRVGQYSLPGIFKLDNKIDKYIQQTSKKTAASHIDTVANDLYQTARDAALRGLSQREIINEVKQKYASVITETRAKTIARTETNRAFTRAQFEADTQFIKQNKLSKKAYKQWRTRSDNPCPFCQKMEAMGKIPFGEAFADIGDNIDVDGKKLGVNFEKVEAGNLHPNCNCIYELVIELE